MTIVDQIKAALSKYGQPECTDPDRYFDDNPELAEIPWRPRFLYILGDTAWAIDVFSGDLVPEFTVAQMQVAQTVDSHLRAAFFVPAGEDYELILQDCIVNHIAILTRVGPDFDFLPLEGLPQPTLEIVTYPVHLPLSLVEQAASLQSFSEPFCAAVKGFAVQYLEFASGARPTGAMYEQEELLLRDSFLSLMAADNRFAGPYDPLELLRWLETQCHGAELRDHYFHSFHDFLLGCLVLDQARDHFTSFATNVLGHSDLSIEYVWLLTSLFHDVGYLVERAADLERIQFGTSQLDIALEGGQIPDYVLAQRQQVWDGGNYPLARTQLASLGHYLASQQSRSPWVPETIIPETLPSHLFDRALYRGYMIPKCHGVASALRLLVELHPYLLREPDPDKRQFLLKHIYLAAVSIPFHHDAFRACLRALGINSISTYRWPFASLLMFIDSVQDDRRDPDLARWGPDMLRGIHMEDNTVIAVVDLDQLSESQIRQVARKRLEARDVLSFLDADGLRFAYPPDFLGEEPS